MLRENLEVWQCGKHEISLARPRIMGVLNVTPDSFSDGGKHSTASEAVECGMRMLDEGADIIDVGGESTRPGFEPVSSEEEAKRIVPVIRELVDAGAIVSVDTRHPDVAKMCVRLGASIVNDVTGFTNPDMVEVAASTKCGCVIMHAGEVPGHAIRRSVTLDSDAKAKAQAKSAAEKAVSADVSADAELASDAASADEALSPAERLINKLRSKPSSKLTDDEKVALADAEAEVEEAAEKAREKLPTPGESPVQSHETAADEAIPDDDALGQLMHAAARGIEAPTVRLVSGGARRFTLPEEAPIMRQVMGFLGDQARTLMRAGVSHDRICVDPGAGFGKYADEDVVIQRATKKMASMGYPLMCAVSRKRFVGAVSGVADAVARDAASTGIALASIEAGARIVRVHDVATMTQMLNAYWAVAHPDPRRAFVSLGSNVGDRMGYLARARVLNDAIPLTCVVATSHVYETDPAYGIATPVANCVIEIHTELAPLVLMDALLDVEAQLGRTRPKGDDGHGPRTCDCDLVWMEGETHAGRKLTLPHPGLCERDYVLVPMEDLMHDPARFFRNSGIDIKPEEERVGAIRADLGELSW